MTFTTEIITSYIRYETTVLYSTISERKVEKIRPVEKNKLVLRKGMK